MVRNTYIDSVKTLLIISVVLTHSLARLGTGSLDEHIVMNFLYTFNMPLFIFVSGFLFSSEKSWSKVLMGGVELFIVYCIFQSIWIAMNHTSLSFKSFFFPQFSLWYLLSLVFWRIMQKGLSSLSQNKCLWIMIAVIVSLCCGLIPIEREVSFQRTFSFFPFFVIGCMCRGTNAVDYIRIADKRIALFIICGLVIIFSFVGKPPYWLVCGRTSFYSYHVDIVLAPFIKLCWYFVAVVLSSCFMNLIPDKEILSKHGSKTLTVYVLHYFPIWALRNSGFRSESLLQLTILSLAISLLLFYGHKFKFVRLLTNPMSICNRK